MIVTGKNINIMNTAYFGFVSLNKFLASFLYLLHYFSAPYVFLMIQIYFFQNVSLEVFSPHDGFH